jgi:hypothetical protein
MAPPPQETGKQRASRIPLDYFKRSNYVERWKLWLTGLALVLAVGWWASGWVSSDQGTMRYSRGPVAAVHATWESECMTCHTSFKPIDSKNWAATVLGHSTAERCETCHAGPPHQANQKPESTPSCAGCHHDHQGRNAMLNWVADSDCTRCHQNLEQHMTGGKPVSENQVTRFDKGHHPEFSILREPKQTDPGKLKFDHQLHMTPGLVVTQGGKPWTLASIPNEADRERYKRQGQGPNDPVKLDCTSCHQTDSADFRIKGERMAGLPVSVFSKRSEGAYMVPITYENQCRACHPLTFDAAAPNLEVPHRLQPEAVTNFLWGAYTSEYVKKHPELPPATVPLPGKELKVEDEKARAEIKSQVVEAEKFLYRDRLTAAQKKIFAHKMTCGECHSYQTQPGAFVPKQIEATQVPDVWFKRAFFNHAAHRAVNCKDCHQRAYPDDSSPSTESKDILLPGLDTCVKCHSPRQGSGATATGGARSDCVECHLYHNGQPQGSLQGIGAADRAPKKPMDLKQFLEGKLEAPK